MAHQDDARMMQQISIDDVLPPSDGATDAAGLGEHIRDAGTHVEEAAEGQISGLSQEEAMQQVRDAKSALSALGFELHGEGDEEEMLQNVLSPQTEEALRQFQDDHDLEVSGRLDPETYESLMAAYEQAVETVRPEPSEDDFQVMPSVEPE